MAVAFSDPRYGWIGTGGALLRTVDGGGTWHVLPLPPSDVFHALRIEAPARDLVNVVFTVAGRNAIWATSRDGGESWETHRVPQSRAAIVDVSVVR
jgi:photosystem II stability/assembly factor-like uncharacterized protein